MKKSPVERLKWTFKLGLYTPDRDQVVICVYSFGFNQQKFSKGKKQYVERYTHILQVFIPFWVGDVVR